MNEFLSMPPQTNQIAEATRAAGASNVSASSSKKGGGDSETGRKTQRKQDVADKWNKLRNSDAIQCIQYPEVFWVGGKRHRFEYTSIA